MASSWRQSLPSSLMFLLLGSILAACVSAAAPIVPSADPFYVPPAGFENQEPGAILRTRKINASFLGFIPTFGVTSHQLLYRTTAINGSAIAGVTTVFKPAGSNVATDRFVSFHTAYDGSAQICDPSYNYQLGSAQVDLISDVEFLLLEAFLIKGYVVSSPDYEGPDAAFGAGRLSGMGVLDSMKAVSNFHSTIGLSSNPKIVGYGYSGGAIATGWAASLQSSYAPNLPIQGWAQGGTPANLTGTAYYIDDTAFSGFLPAAVDGLNKPSAYAAKLKPTLSTIVTPYGQSKLDFAAQNCIADLFNFFEMSLLSTKIQTLGDKLYYDPAIASVMEQQTMGVDKSETPAPPVYLYHATLDEIIPYSNASTLVDSWCADGAAVDFVTFGNGGHFTTEILGFVGAFEFVQSAFAGTAQKSGCTRSTTLNNTLDPLALGTDLEPILVTLINVLSKLGQDDSNLIASNLTILESSVST